MWSLCDLGLRIDEVSVELLAAHCAIFPIDLSPKVCGLGTRMRIERGGLPGLSLTTRSTFLIVCRGTEMTLSRSYIGVTPSFLRRRFASMVICA